MKHRHLKILILGALIAPLSACGQLPEQQATIVVVDQDGKPVAGAKVGMGFDIGLAKTEYGTESTTKRAITPANGRVVISGGNASGYSGMSARKEGYYDAHHVFQAKSRVSGRWEPWNPEIKLVLKEKRNPVAIYGFRIGPGVGKLRALEFPAASPRGPAGFDLFKRDWVAPHGTGAVSDVVLEYAEPDGPAGGGVLRMCFPNPGDGVIGPLANEGGAGLRSGHEAPADGFKPEISFPGMTRRQKPTPDAIDMRGCWYVLRLRTRLDEKGNVLSAHIGKHYGLIEVGGGTNWMPCDLWGLCYYLNPDPHSRNLECDPTKNLFTDLDKGNWPTEP